MKIVRASSLRKIYPQIPRLLYTPTSPHARPGSQLNPIYLSYRPLHTSPPRLTRPSISSNGLVQPPAYLAALDALYASLADAYPQGRAVYTPGQDNPQCPPLIRKEMEKVGNVATSKGRCSLVNMDVARAFVRGALDVGGKKGKGKEEGRVVVEAFPGPGGVTRALLELPRSEVRRVIILEEELKYLKQLKELEYYDDRVHVLPHSGFIWETYDEIRDLGLLDDVAIEDWKTAPHSTLNFIGHLPLGQVGEQLIAQLFRAIPERSWLFKYGRMRMSWLLSKRMLDRIQCAPKRATRCKLTIVAEATANLSPVVPDQTLGDYNRIFFPKADPTAQGKKIILAKRIGQPFVSLNVDPLAEGAIMPRTEANELIARAVINSTGRKSSPASASDKAEVERLIDEAGVKGLINEADARGMIKEVAGTKKKTKKKSEKEMALMKADMVERVPTPSKPETRVTLEKWDYVLRQLFILKSTPLEKAIQNLGAGAAILNVKLIGADVPEERRVNVKMPINALSIHDFARIVEEFDRWPFAPDVLFIADQADESRN